MQEVVGNDSDDHERKEGEEEFKNGHVRSTAVSRTWCGFTLPAPYVQPGTIPKTTRERLFPRSRFCADRLHYCAGCMAFVSWEAAEPSQRPCPASAG
jgi:hypothetical protein